MVSGPSDAGSADVEQASTVFGLLASQRRISLLLALRANGEPMTLSDLTAAVLRREHGTGRPDVSEPHVERLRLELHHVHLPKLDTAAVVDYDADSQSVALGTASGSVEAVVDAVLDG